MNWIACGGCWRRSCSRRRSARQGTGYRRRSGADPLGRDRRRSLSAAAGVPHRHRHRKFFGNRPRRYSLLRDRQILQAAELGLIRLSAGRPPDLDAGAAAPGGAHALPACRTISRPDRAAAARIDPRISISFLLHQTDDVLGRAATNGLRRRFPQMSAAPAAVKRAAMAPASATLQGTIRHRGADAVAADPCLGRVERRAGAMVSGVHRLASCREFRAATAAEENAPPARSSIAGLHRHRGTLPRGEIGRAFDAGDRRIRLPARKTSGHPGARAQRSRNPRRDRAAWPDAACAGPDRIRPRARRPSRKR